MWIYQRKPSRIGFWITGRVSLFVEFVYLIELSVKIRQGPKARLLLSCPGSKQSGCQGMAPPHLPIPFKKKLFSLFPILFLSLIQPFSNVTPYLFFLLPIFLFFPCSIGSSPYFLLPPSCHILSHLLLSSFQILFRPSTPFPYIPLILLRTSSPPPHRNPGWWLLRKEQDCLRCLEPSNWFSPLARPPKFRPPARNHAAIAPAIGHRACQRLVLRLTQASACAQ